MSQVSKRKKKRANVCPPKKKQHYWGKAIRGIFVIITNSTPFSNFHPFWRNNTGVFLTFGSSYSKTSHSTITPTLLIFILSINIRQNHTPTPEIVWRGRGGGGLTVQWRICFWLLQLRYMANNSNWTGKFLFFNIFRFHVLGVNCLGRRE